MSTSSDRAGASPGAPDPAGALVPQLRVDRDHAAEQLQRLEEEYAGVLDDPGVLQEDRDGTRRMLEAARRTFEAAEAALAQAESGEYGRCVKCGGPIGAERLEALPGVAMCVTCQAAT
jgi:RNA polymerase-binding transcription factor DksA